MGNCDDLVGVGRVAGLVVELVGLTVDKGALGVGAALVGPLVDVKHDVVAYSDD